MEDVAWIELNSDQDTFRIPSEWTASPNFEGSIPGERGMSPSRTPQIPASKAVRAAHTNNIMFQIPEQPYDPSVVEWQVSSPSLLKKIHEDARFPSLTRVRREMASAIADAH